jgi:hypothetical protein
MAQRNRAAIDDHQDRNDDQGIPGRQRMSKRQGTKAGDHDQQSDRGVSGNCLYCLWKSSLPNSGSPTAISRDKRGHDFSSLAQKWHK